MSIRQSWVKHEGPNQMRSSPQRECLANHFTSCVISGLQVVPCTLIASLTLGAAKCQPWGPFPPDDRFIHYSSVLLLAIEESLAWL